MKKEPKKKRKLYGLGFDHKDEHLRYTRGPNFELMGGSETTHNVLQEKAIKFNERLRKRGKTLEEIEPKEFYDIGEEIGLKPLPEDKDKMLAAIDRFQSLSAEEKTNFRIGRRTGRYTELTDLLNPARRRAVEQIVKKLSQGDGKVDDQTIYALMEGFI